MIYVIKEGVYTQGVWSVSSIEGAELLRDELIGLERDDYHQFRILSCEEGEDILTGVDITPLKVKPLNTITVHVEE